MQVKASELEYLAFVLSKETREILIKALGSIFPIRVCHHITIAYDITERAIKGLEALVNNKDVQFFAKGMYIGKNYATIEVVLTYVDDGKQKAGRPLGHSDSLYKTRRDDGGDLFHITYERERHIMNRDCYNILNRNSPYMYRPLGMYLEGEFVMIPKSRETPIEEQSVYTNSDMRFLTNLGFDPLRISKDVVYNFSEDKVSSNLVWVAVGSVANGGPCCFIYRNKQGYSRSVYFDPKFDSEYQTILAAWEEWKVNKKLQNQIERKVS